MRRLSKSYVDGNLIDAWHFPHAGRSGDGQGTQGIARRLRTKNAVDRARRKRFSGSRLYCGIGPKLEAEEYYSGGLLWRKAAGNDGQYFSKNKHPRLPLPLNDMIGAGGLLYCLKPTSRELRRLWFQWCLPIDGLPRDWRRWTRRNYAADHRSGAAWPRGKRRQEDRWRYHQHLPLCGYAMPDAPPHRTLVRRIIALLKKTGVSPA
jgi:hypothetical protein